MQLPRASIKAPTGLSFNIPDLLMLQAWTDFHDLRIVIELDTCAEADEYEELVAVYDRHRTFRWWMIWRSCEGIVVQPTMGRTMLFQYHSLKQEFCSLKVPGGQKSKRFQYLKNVSISESSAYVNGIVCYSISWLMRWKSLSPREISRGASSKPRQALYVR